MEWVHIGAEARVVFESGPSRWKWTLGRLTPRAFHLPETRAMLAQKVAAGIGVQATVTGLHYMGDEGGILCKLDLGSATDNAGFVSITRLRFDARLPLARAIAAYQKHRVKRLRRQAA